MIKYLLRNILYITEDLQACPCLLVADISVNFSSSAGTEILWLSSGELCQYIRWNDSLVVSK